MNLSKSVVLVTGAGSGIGEAIALEMAAAEANVVAVDVDERALSKCLDGLAAHGGESIAICADCALVSEMDSVVESTVERLGRVDVLVNCAGVMRPRNIMDITEDDWDAIFSVNARGLFFCMQRVAREMILQGGGRIINIGSIAARGFSNPSSVAYAGSKGAVASLTMSAALQLASHNITVNVIHPGMTITKLLMQIMESRAEHEGKTLEQVRTEFEAPIPLGRANEPKDIAALAVFLASDGARNITGQSFTVDGGLIPSY